MRQGAEPATLLDALGDLRRAWKYLLCGAIAGLCAALVFLTTATPHYRAQMIVEPANPMAEYDAASAGLNGGDASQRSYGEQIGAARAADFMRFQTMLLGPSIAGSLRGDKKIVAHIDARDLESPEAFAEYMRKRVRIDPVGETTQKKIAYFHPDPQFAAYFLATLHAATDGRIRGNVRTEAERRIAYLQKSLEANFNPEHRRSLTDLMLEQERLLMLSSIDQPYAAAIVEPASSSSRPEWPDTRLVLCGFIFAGAAAGFAAYGFRHGGR